MKGGGRAGLVELPEFGEAGGGRLAVASCGPQVPFVVQRVFSIYDLAVGTARGGHAHRRCEQFLICAAGAIEIVAEDAQGVASFRLSHPARGLYVPPMTWLTLQSVAESSIVMVLASHGYDEADYIREHAAFEAVLGGAGE